MSAAQTVGIEGPGASGPAGGVGQKRKRQRKAGAGGKKAKTARDPNAPKKAKTAFICFCEVERPRQMAMTPTAAPTDITKACAAAWKATSAEERAPYQALADTDKLRFQAAMQNYRPPPGGGPAGGPAADGLAAARQAKRRVDNERALKEVQVPLLCGEAASPKDQAKAHENVARCAMVLKAMHSREAQRVGSAPEENAFTRQLEMVLGCLMKQPPAYPHVHLFAEDVRQMLVRKSAFNQSNVDEATAAFNEMLVVKFERLVTTWVVEKTVPLEQLNDDCPAGGMRCKKCDLPHGADPALPADWVCKVCTDKEEALRAAAEERQRLKKAAEEALAKQREAIERERETGSDSGNPIAGAAAAVAKVYRQDSEGKFVCETCGWRFDTIVGISSHSRGCTGPIESGITTPRPTLALQDDMDVLATLVCRPLENTAESTAEESYSQLREHPRLWLTSSWYQKLPEQEGLPARMLPDVTALLEFFNTFRTQLRIGEKFTMEHMAKILLSTERIESFETLCCWMTKQVVKLSQAPPVPCGPMYFKYDKDHFFGLDPVTLCDTCLEGEQGGLAWEAVLQAFTSHQTKVFGVNEHIHQTITLLGQSGFFALGLAERVVVLQHLTTEMLGTPHCRDVLNENLVNVEIEEQKIREAKAKSDRDEWDWAREKAKRRPTAYNLFLQNELTKVKLENPEMAHRDAFAQSAMNWKALTEAENDAWTEKSRALQEDEQLTPTEQQVSAVLEDVIQQLVDDEQSVASRRYAAKIEALAIRAEPLGIDRHGSRYWILPTFPDKLLVEDRPVIASNFRPSPAEAFLGSKGHVWKRLDTAHAHVATMLEGASKEVLQKAGSRLGLSLSVDDEKSAMISTLMATDADGEVCAHLIDLLREHATKYHSCNLSLEELEEWNLVFPEALNGYRPKVQDSENSAEGDAEEKSPEEIAKQKEELAKAQEVKAKTALVEEILDKGGLDRMSAEFYDRPAPPTEMEMPPPPPPLPAKEPSELEEMAADPAFATNKTIQREALSARSPSPDQEDATTPPPELDSKVNAGDTQGRAEGGAGEAASQANEAAGNAGGDDMSEDEEDKPEGMAFVAAENNELRAEISRVKALQNIGASIPKTEGGDQSALADEAARNAEEEKAAEEDEEAAAAEAAAAEADEEDAAAEAAAAAEADDGDVKGDAGASSATDNVGSSASALQTINAAIRGGAQGGGGPSGAGAYGRNASEDLTFVLAPESDTKITEVTISQEGPLGLKFNEELVIERADLKGIGYMAGVRVGMQLQFFQGQSVRGFKATMEKLRVTARPWAMAFTAGRLPPLQADELIPPQFVGRLEAEFQEKAASREGRRAMSEPWPGECRACRGSHRPHTCGRNKPGGAAAAPQPMPSSRPGRKSKGAAALAQFQKLIEQLSRETGVTQDQLRTWFDNRKQKQGGRVRVGANNRSVPIGSVTATRSYRRPRAPRAVKEREPPMIVDMYSEPVIPPDLAKLPVQPPAATQYWGDDNLIRMGGWRWIDTPEGVDAVLAYLNPAGAREAALRANLLRRAPDLKEAMVQVRHVAEKEEEEKTLALLQAEKEAERSRNPTRRSRAAKEAEKARAAAEAAAAEAAEKQGQRGGSEQMSEASRRCHLIAAVLIKTLEDLPAFPGRATHGQGRVTWRQQVTATCKKEDWRPLVELAQTLADDVILVGQEWDKLIGTPVVPQYKGPGRPPNDKDTWEGWLRQWNSLVTDMGGGPARLLLHCHSLKLKAASLNGKDVRSHKRKIRPEGVAPNGLLPHRRACF